MEFYEIVLIVLIIAFVVYIFGKEIYKKIKKIPTGECACCHSNSKNLLKKYRKKYGKKDYTCNK